MTKQINITIEINENENIQQITDVIMKALKDSNISYVSPVMAVECKN